MSTAALSFEDPAIALEVRSVTGTARLGQPSRHELELFSVTPVDVEAVLRKPCSLRFMNEVGERYVPGIVTSVPAAGV